MDHFSPVLPVVVNLRNQGLQGRHWDQIHKMIGFEIKGRPEITLGELIEKKVVAWCLFDADRVWAILISVCDRGSQERCVVPHSSVGIQGRRDSSEPPCHIISDHAPATLS